MGQQVSVRAANTLLGRIAKSLGRSVSTPFEGLTLLFPSAEDLASQPDLEIARLGMPLSRARTILAIAKAVAAGALNIGEGSDPDALIAESLELGGVGRWTAQVLAMRVAGWPDAFPSADLGLRRAARGLSAVALERRAETWRPWRAYAAAHLWASLFDEVRT
jgi:AraC family transcriptional regulator of adaptative response / DNA-3-methyladenine glycosylase II